MPARPDNDHSGSDARRAELTEALLGIVAEGGLERVSVREVAAAAEVSIGTVQHYFPSKDEMLVASFEAIVERIRGRVASVDLGSDVRANLEAVLREILPLDRRRRTEARVQIAFSARAVNSPRLAAIQRDVLAEVRDGLAEGFERAWGDRASPARCRLAAHLALAAADGLALHAVSAEGWLSPRRQGEALALLLDALLAE